ncbi:signal peptidase II [Demetria terragena]|uniref:signal peptidase II n=1 Tax=Demetria terragena TaxID=63959 RepID=UPI000A02687F|nr:signal peptidase II [Demetria terragena]
MQTGAGATLNPDPASTTARADAGPPVRSTRLVVVLALIALGSYALDQGTKAWVVANLEFGVAQDFPIPLIQLRRTSNPGAAFSLATNATWLLTIVAIVVIAATIWAARRLRSRGWAAALGLLIGGALGNLTDRFFREPGGGQGHVVDFLQFTRFPVIDFPIFNVADTCIVSAASLICILAFVGINIDGTRITSDEDTEDSEDLDQPSQDSELEESDSDRKDRP